MCNRNKQYLGNNHINPELTRSGLETKELISIYLTFTTTGLMGHLRIEWIRERVPRHPTFRNQIEKEQSRKANERSRRLKKRNCLGVSGAKKECPKK